MAKRKPNCDIQRSTNWLSFWCVVGILLSLYTLYVEIKNVKDPNNYRALCDINEYISCSKVFMSKYGRGFGLLPPESPFNLPNPVFGIFFYLTQLMVAMFMGTNKTLIRFFTLMAAISNIGSIYLGYILYFILQDMCVVCVSCYIVNFFMLLAAISRYKLAAKIHQKVD